ncbi:MAG: hypothetical protein ABIO39_12475 [Caulobacteraceae bacterium]
MRMFGLGPRREETLVDPQTGEAVVVEHHGAVSAEATAAHREAERLREERDQLLRREARRRRSKAPVFGLVVALIAVIGVVWMVLAFREGSFAAGGAVVDAKIAQVTEPARQAADNAAQRSGEAVEKAGQSLEAQGRKIKDTGRN